MPLAVGDLASGDGLTAALAAAAAAGGGLAAIINAAAISSPAVCARDPAAATAINVPTKLVAALQEWWAEAGGGGTPPVLIQISTDQTYGGDAPVGGWPEDAPLAPVNEYGRSKVEAERVVAEGWPNAVSLRCSVMIGATAPLAVPVAGTRFLQFVDGAIAQGTEEKNATFFEDEWRNFVAVEDVAAVVVGEVNARAPGAASGCARPPVLNVGGPARLSRLDFARLVARVRGAPENAVRGARAADGPPRAVVSPPDIAMNVTRVQALGYKLTTMQDAVAACAPGA